MLASTSCASRLVAEQAHLSSFWQRSRPGWWPRNPSCQLRFGIEHRISLRGGIRSAYSSSKRLDSRIVRTSQIMRSLSDSSRRTGLVRALAAKAHASISTQCAMILADPVASNVGSCDRITLRPRGSVGCWPGDRSAGFSQRGALQARHRVAQAGHGGDVGRLSTPGPIRRRTSSRMRRRRCGRSARVPEPALDGPFSQARDRVGRRAILRGARVDCQTRWPCARLEPRCSAPEHILRFQPKWQLDLTSPRRGRDGPPCEFGRQSS